MKKGFSRFAFLFAFLVLINIVYIPLLAHAAPETNTDWFSGFVPCGKEVDATEAAKSCDFNSLVLLGQRVINFLFFASFMMTVVLLILTGFKYMSAGDSSSQLAKAKQTFWTITKGFILVLSAWLIINTTVGILLRPESCIKNPLEPDKPLPAECNKP